MSKKKLKYVAGYRRKKKRAPRMKEDFPEQNILQQAMAFHKAGRTTEAETLYNKILSVKPDNPSVLYLLAMLSNQTGNNEKAIELLGKALTVKPDFIDAHYKLGGILGVQGKLNEAAACFRRVIGLKPDVIYAHYDLGVILERQGRLTDAVASYRKVLKLKPDNLMALYNLGKAQKEQGNLAEAVASYRKLLNSKQDSIKAHEIMAKTLGIRVEADEIMGKAHDNMIFTLNYMSNIPQEEIYNESLKRGERFTEYINKGAPEYENSLRTDRRLRIGYVSPDFRMHSVLFFIEPVIRSHEKEQVEIFCYANVEKPDRYTGHLQALADHWNVIAGKNDEEITARIKKDRIDILVDLAGFTSSNNLPVFARKPAPVQVTWLGYPNTTGLQTMDYRLTDAVADPPGEADRFHIEKLIRLKHGFLCYSPFQSIPEVNSLPCRDSGHITFGSFNNLNKVSREVVKTWAAILHDVPGSHLLLKADQFADDRIKTRFREVFADEGITDERLIMYKRLPRIEEHLGLYNKVDIGLDPFPYNGTTTTCEALMMGVPVVTLRGDRHAGRVGASLLHRTGLADLVATSVDGYIESARSLAFDRQRLEELRTGLRERMQKSELMDSGLFTRHLEDVYRSMWRDYCESTYLKN